MVPVEVTLRFRARAILLTAVLFFASPRSLSFRRLSTPCHRSAAIVHRCSHHLPASLSGPYVSIRAHGHLAAGAMSVQPDALVEQIRLRLSDPVPQRLKAKIAALVGPDLACGQFRHRGRIVEHGTVTDIFDNPRQPYTRSLLASIPSAVTHVPHPRTRPIATAY
jgi:hypothetical protein